MTAPGSFPIPARSSYDVTVTRDGEWWLIEVDGIGATQANTLRDIRPQAADVIATMSDRPNRTGAAINITVNVEGATPTPAAGGVAAESDADIDDRVRAAKAQRLDLTSGDRDLVHQVAGLLYADDPVDIGDGTNPDEYTAEAESIVIGMPAATSVDDVTALAHRTFVAWFSPEDAGPAARYATVARHIWDAWNAAPAPRGDQS